MRLCLPSKPLPPCALTIFRLPFAVRICWSCRGSAPRPQVPCDRRSNSRPKVLRCITDWGGWLPRNPTAARSSTLKRRLPSIRTIGRRFTHLPKELRLAGREAEAASQLERYESMVPALRRHYEDPLVDAMDSVRSASAQQVFNDARALQDSGDLEGALASYGSVLEIDPNHAQAHVNLIVVNGQLQRHEDVARHYERAVELNPSIAEAHYNYGVSRHLAADYPGAAAAFRMALAINPQDANAHNNLATALEQSEQHAEAARHYRLAIEHDPSHPQANYHLGRRLAESGRYREALPLLHKALERENQGAPLQAYLLAIVYRELADAARAQQYARLALAKARAGGHGDLAGRVASEFGL